VAAPVAGPVIDGGSEGWADMRLTRIYYGPGRSTVGSRPATA